MLLVWRSAYRDWHRLKLVFEADPSFEPIVLFSMLCLVLTLLFAR